MKVLLNIALKDLTPDPVWNYFGCGSGAVGEIFGGQRRAPDDVQRGNGARKPLHHNGWSREVTPAETPSPSLLFLAAILSYRAWRATGHIPVEGPTKGPGSC